MRNCKCYCNLAGIDFPKCLLLLWMVLNKEVLNMKDTASRLVIFCSERKIAIQALQGMTSISVNQLLAVRISVT